MNLYRTDGSDSFQQFPKNVTLEVCGSSIILKSLSTVILIVDFSKPMTYSKLLDGKKIRAIYNVSENRQSISIDIVEEGGSITPVATYISVKQNL